MRRYLPLAAFLLLAVPALACGSATGAGGKATATALPQGQTAKVKNWDITLTSVEQPGQALAWSQYGNTSPAAGTWLVPVVRMRNTGTQNFGVNGHDFEVQAGGTTYAVSTDGGSFAYSTFKGGQQLGGQVPPGVEVMYYLPFDVAPNLGGAVLVFKQDTKPRFALP